MVHLEITRPGSPNRILISAEAGQKLSEAIWLSGLVPPVSLCGGLALCGKCRCCFAAHAPLPCMEDTEFFSKQDIKAGWRLACHHTVPPDPVTCLEIPYHTCHPRHSVKKGFADGKATFLGLDLGTTTMEWQITNSQSVTLEAGAQLNPQGGAGGDIVSRLQYASTPQGLDRLSDLVREALGEIAQTAAPDGPERMCIAANSAMTEILLKKSITGLLGAPYHLSFKGGVWCELSLPSISRPIPTYFPPLLGPFVGGDASAGLVPFRNDPLPMLLMDLGTNAEFLLVTSWKKLYAASVPMGPALEGIGPVMGRLPAQGIITGFELSPTGLAHNFYDGKFFSCATGISATGYLSLLAILHRIMILQPDGQFNFHPDLPLAQKIATGLRQDYLDLPGNVKLFLSDIELLLKVKATFRTGLDMLLAKAGLTPADIVSANISGTLGQYTSIDDLVQLGFLPAGLAQKTKKHANTAMAGSVRLASTPELAHWLEDVCAKTTVLELAGTPDFMEKYLANMVWG